VIKAIVFDFYGVIRSDEYHDWLSNHGIKRDKKFTSATANLDKGIDTLDQFFEGLSKLSNIPPEEIRKEFLAQGSLDKELLALILKLKDKYKIALLSNASSSHLRDVMKQANIYNLFDEVVISSEIGYTKPSNQIFDHLLKCLGIKADEAIFIDDNQSFVDAANNLGITGIKYTNVDSLIKSFEEMGIIS
jgi:putative hydrolase of the HAD superfamily